MTGARTTVSDVRTALSAGRDPRQGSGPWTMRFIELADAQFEGVWRVIEISGEEALGVILPPHAGEPCRGDRLPLVPPGGASVKEAADTLRRIQAEYAVDNRSCWGRITQAVAEPFSPMILTTSPLATDDYRSIAYEPGRLYHLDGFHRLVGWAWASRLGADRRLQVFVAGDGYR